MAFCGYCGFLLPPKVTTCPRCGVAVTPDGKSEYQHAYDATMISTTDRTELSKSSPSSKPEIVQGPGQFTSENDQTPQVIQPVDIPVLPFEQQTLRSPLPEYYPQALIPPSPPPPPNSLLSDSSDFSITQSTTYPGFHFPPYPSTTQTKSRRTLLIVLLVLLLVIGVVGATILVVGPNRILQLVRVGETTPQSTAILSTSQSTPMPTPTPIPEQQAQSVIDRYYVAINAKDYQTAYNLWVNYPDSYQKFANGFANTLHDDYQFGQITQQSDGTVQVWITLTATETSSKQKTYQGYYIVGQQRDGSWKIIKGHLKASERYGDNERDDTD
jgi:hypothetical protein